MSESGRAALLLSVCARGLFDSGSNSCVCARSASLLGSWSARGCRSVVRDSSTACVCDGLSTFAVIARPNPDPVSVRSSPDRLCVSSCVCVCVYHSLVHHRVIGFDCLSCELSLYLSTVIQLI